MNKISVTLIVLFIISFFVSCNRQENDPTPGLIQFGIERPLNGGGRTNEVLQPAAILLSIINTQGNAIETDKKIALYSFGNSFISESIQLGEGEYKLIKFLVLDIDNKIIYAAPLIGSQQTQYVTQPLPLGFSITANNSTLVSPQVLALDEASSPESFGYASFGFEIVKAPSLLLSEVILDDCFLGKRKLAFTYKDDRIEEVKWSYNIYQNWVDACTESRIYSNGILAKINITNKEGVGERNYEYSQNNMKRITSNYKPLNMFHPYYYNEVLFDEYQNNNLPKKLFAKGLVTDRTILLEFDTHRNLTKVIWVNQDSKIIREVVIQYDNYLNPLKSIIQADFFHFGSWASPLDIISLFYSTNNPVKLHVKIGSVVGDYSFEYKYDSQNRPLESIIWDGASKYPYGKTSYKYLNN